MISLAELQLFAVFPRRRARWCRRAHLHCPSAVESASAPACRTDSLRFRRQTALPRSLGRKRWGYSHRRCGHQFACPPQVPSIVELLSWAKTSPTSSESPRYRSGGQPEKGESASRVEFRLSQLKLQPVFETGKIAHMTCGEMPLASGVERTNFQSSSTRSTTTGFASPQTTDADTPMDIPSAQARTTSGMSTFT